MGGAGIGGGGRGLGFSVGCGVLAACVVFLLGRVVWFWPRVLWLSVFACLGVLCGMVHSSGGCVGVVAWVSVDGCRFICYGIFDVKVYQPDIGIHHR